MKSHYRKELSVIPETLEDSYRVRFFPKFYISLH